MWDRGRIVPDEADRGSDGGEVVTVDVDPEDFASSVLDPDQSCQGAEESGLTRSVGPGDPGHLTSIECEVEVVEDGLTP